MGFSDPLSSIVLTTGLDLLDLSEPVSQTQTKGKKSESSSKSSSLKKKADGSDLISGDSEQRAQALRGPETSSLDLGKAKVCSSCGLSCQLRCDTQVQDNFQRVNMGMEKINFWELERG